MGNTIDFNFCTPDANSFDKEMLVKTIEEWNVEYVALTEKTGYWIADNPFNGNCFETYKNLIAAFPVVKNNNAGTSTDPNPFDTIHLPEWLTRCVIELIIRYYINNVESSIVNDTVHEWGNLYWKDKSKPIEAFRIPHIDYPNGIVGNLWLSDHPYGSSGTNLYEYTGNVHGLHYDFQVDDTHPLYNRYKSLSLTNRLPQWKNFSDEEAEEFGFKKLAMVPGEYSKITMYKSNTPHCPYIDPTIDFRWSHTFAFEHDTLSMKDVFR
jgi:hypothetical protein|tara:strand:+ start:1181 stop:1978 length:798 start_codon:yes stop_codon:yes gene_type:complete